MGIAGMVLGIIAIVFVFIPFRRDRRNCPVYVGGTAVVDCGF